MSKKLSKQKMKEMETPEEKRQRRLNKKAAKTRNAMEKMGWDEEYRGYTNSDNPFGDEYLLETCAWKKKLDKEGRSDMMEEDVKKLQKAKMIENKRELEKVKKRRVERELERTERERDQESMQRDKETAYFRQWEQQEDTFHLNQAKLRSKIRVDEGRAKPIDLLAQYINSAEDDDSAVQVTEPYNLLHGLSTQDLEDLQEDIWVYLQLEQGRNGDFWRDITLVTEQEVLKLKKAQPSSSHADSGVDRRSCISHSVLEDIENIFKGKTLAQLNILQTQIQQKLKGGEGVDVGYWESLGEELKWHMARQRLRERHQELLRCKLYKLKQEQCLESDPLFPIKNFREKVAKENDDEQKEIKKEEELKNSPIQGTSSDLPCTSSQQQLDDSDGDIKGDDVGKDEGDEEEGDWSEEEGCSRVYQQGAYSPTLLPCLPAGVVAFECPDELQRLSFNRKQVIHTGQAEQDEEDELMRRAKVGMDAEEAQFSVQVALPQQESVWSDKYRPRKPRFFNRVHTGFEWNKYNQTHYDIDNPPPKIVQGYKFNIFYPDLIDKTQAPDYKVIPCSDNKDFAILRFIATAPYEDIAFKIVNREWEQASRRGFRCQYQNNILQLWFHFKRFRYRR